MKALMAITLILFGSIWLFYATVHRSIVRTGAYSDAMALENDLHGWVMKKVLEGRLRESDVVEIFPNDSMRLGGENKNRNFQTMISDIAQMGVPPVWPGIFAVVIGFFGAFSAKRSPSKNPIAEQTGVSDGDKATT